MKAIAYVILIVYGVFAVVYTLALLAPKASSATPWEQVGVVSAATVGIVVYMVALLVVAEKN